jgi:hypothetical protein
MKAVRFALRVFTLMIDYRTGGVEKLPMPLNRYRAGTTKNEMHSVHADARLK